MTAAELEARRETLGASTNKINSRSVANRLTLIRMIVPGRALYSCVCGTIKEIATRHVNSNATRSCGCIMRDFPKNLTHGHSRPMKRTPEYRAWSQMKNRCYNENCPRYAEYGGRGIRVCQRWKDSFQTFLSDVGYRPPGKRLSLGRKNNDGHYDPGNCEWQNQHQQNLNKRSSHRVTLGGRTMTVTEWALERGLIPRVVFTRLSRGWPLEKALSK